MRGNCYEARHREDASGPLASSRRHPLTLSHPPRLTRSRAGVASLDYVLVLGVLLPLAVFVMWAGPRMMRLAYEMLCVLVSWPFV